ncbi:hypothetical protein A6A07_11640 [Streptomyces sp. CB03911]|nr:hypothetical protein A6A07_11640 [Streptomyces sp. CB03911]
MQGGQVTTAQTSGSAPGSASVLTCPADVKGPSADRQAMHSVSCSWPYEYSPAGITGMIEMVRSRTPEMGGAGGDGASDMRVPHGQ